VVKEIRPKLTIAELRLILKGLKESGYDKAYRKPEYDIYRRIELLSKGQHTRKGRIWKLPEGATK